MWRSILSIIAVFICTSCSDDITAENITRPNITNPSNNNTNNPKNTTNPDNTNNQPDNTNNQPDNTNNQPDNTNNQPDNTNNQPDNTNNQPDNTNNQPDNTNNQPEDQPRTTPYELPDDPHEYNSPSPEELQKKLCPWSDPKDDASFIRLPKGKYFTLNDHYHINAPFELMKREVTWQDYLKCVDAGVCDAPHDKLQPYHLRAAVHYLLPEDAETYCQWIGGRLPTLQEWQYAALLDEQYRVRSVLFPWGNTMPDYCIHAAYRMKSFYQDDPIQPRSYECYNGLVYSCPIADHSSIVGCYPAGDSPLGFQDMAGNVHEWVSNGDQKYIAMGGSVQSVINDITIQAEGVWFYEIYDLSALGVRCARDIP